MLSKDNKDAHPKQTEPIEGLITNRGESLFLLKGQCNPLRVMQPVAGYRTGTGVALVPQYRRILYPDLVIGDKDPRPIGKWGRMHMKYLEAEHPGLYERLILDGTLYRHLADADERAVSMLERLIEQIAAQEGVTEILKEAQPLEWVQ